MIRKISDNPEIYEHVNRHGIKVYRIEDKSWGSGGKFLSEQEFKDMCGKEGKFKVHFKIPTEM